MRTIAMDIHRVAAETVALCEEELSKLGRVPMLRDQLEAFARKELTHDDHVAIEATGNAASVAVRRAGCLLRRLGQRRVRPDRSGPSTS